MSNYPPSGDFSKFIRLPFLFLLVRSERARLKYTKYSACRYYNNIKVMSEIIKDELVKPLDRAVWNVEHVIKFSKSKHLRYQGRDISLLDYYGTTIVLALPFILILWCINFILNNAEITKQYFSINLMRDRIKYFSRPKLE